MKDLFQQNFIVTGTGTDVGKTMCAAHLLSLCQGTYWKPIQTGAEKDRETVQARTGLDDTHFLKEVYHCTRPLSPHEAAFHDGVCIDLEKIQEPQLLIHKPLIIEGAGGVFVPLNEKELMIDLFCHLRLPVVIAARSTLGTINHTLMTISCLRARKVPLLGVMMIGPFMPENEKAIAHFGDIEILGRVHL